MLRLHTDKKVSKNITMQNEYENVQTQIASLNLYAFRG
jgi:hypothetical protein